MSANVLLRVPGASISVDPPPPDARATRYASRSHSRSPRPARCLRCVYIDATRKALRWTLRIIIGASERGEPLREGRLWRSRRSGRRRRVGGAGSTLTAAPEFPLRRRDLRHAEALRAV